MDGAGLGRGDDIVGWQGVLRMGQRHVNNLGAQGLEGANRLAGGYLDAWLHPLDEVLAGHAHAQAADVAAERGAIIEE